MGQNHDIPEALERYPHISPQSVIWNDMDAMQHVNNTVYFRYLESARIAFFTNALPELPALGARNFKNSIALAEVRCRFKIPLTYPDKILIGNAVSEIAQRHFVMQQEIFSTRLGLVVAEGDARLVFYDYQNSHKIDIDESLRRQLKAVSLAP